TSCRAFPFFATVSSCPAICTLSLHGRSSDLRPLETGRGGDTALVPVGGDRPRGLPAEDSRRSLLDETGWGLSIRPPPGQVVDPPLQGSCLKIVIGAQAEGGPAVGLPLLGPRGHGAQDAFTGNADLADGSGDYGVEVLHVVGVGGVVGASADAEEQSAVDRGLGELGPVATVADAAGQFP